VSDDGARLDAAEEAEFAELTRREELIRLRADERKRRWNQQLRTKIQAALRRDAGMSPTKRSPGRPGWTAALFQERWGQALERGGLDQSATAADVAPFFDSLDGTRRIDPDHLRRLAKRLLGPPE
jgi:hypothetical protein